MELKNSYRNRLLVILVVSSLCLLQVETSNICSDLPSILDGSRLSTKTGYFQAVKDDSYVEQFQGEVEGCTADQVWFLGRHGTRYPINQDYAKNLIKIAKDVVEHHEQGRGCLDEVYINQLKDWFPIYSVHDKGQLHDTGVDELHSIGQHWKQMFPTIFNTSYNPIDYKVQFTVKNRTQQSAYHFLRGMFGDDAIGRIELPLAFAPNFILRFYEACPHWIKEVYANNLTTYYERILFEQTGEFQNVVHSVSARLGYMHPIDFRFLNSIYQECQYEKAWWPNIQPVWCSPFTDHDIMVLEYHEDLKYYYEDSYGNELNGEIACKTLTDLYKHFVSTVSSGISLPKAILYFSHDKALLKILTAMKMFKEDMPLRHDTFTQMKNRKFRTSVMSSFANNIGFVLYKCGKEYKVGSFYQGFPVPPLGGHCKGLLCSWQQFKHFFKPISTNCDLSKLCMNHDEL